MNGSRLRLAVLACVLSMLWPSPSAADPLFGEPIPYDLPPIDPYTSVDGIPPRGIAVGDLNEDGIPDIVLPSYVYAGTNATTVSVFLGKGDGTFQARQDYSVGAAGILVTIADVNADGKKDVLLATEEASLWTLPGRGNGTFEPAVSTPLSGAPVSMAVGDLNEDGKLDVALASGGVLLGNGDGTFQSLVTTPPIGWGVGIGDVNRDGKPDIVTAFPSGASGNAYDPVGVALGNGDGTFQPEKSYQGGGFANFSINVADLDGDGHLDFVVESLSHISILQGNASDDYPVSTNYEIDMSQGYGVFQGQGLAIADFDNDGVPDLAVARWPGNPAGMLAFRGKIDEFFGDYILERDLTYGSSNSYAVAAADLNRDGRMDLVSVGEVFLNIGPPARPVAPSPASELSIRPNGPIGGSLALTYRAPATAPVTIEIFDVRGRLVARRTASPTGTAWGTTSFESLHSGVYLVRIGQSGQRRTSRAVVVR